MSQHFTGTRTSGSLVLTTITDGAYQYETLTVVGTASGTGNLTVTLTAAGLPGSPVALAVPITNGDSATVIAAAIAAAFTANDACSRCFTFTPSSNLVKITAKVTRANDTTLAMVITAGLGITTSLTSGVPAANGADGVLLSELNYGDRLSGTGIAADAYVVSVDDAANTVTMSEAATDGAPTAGTVRVENHSLTSLGSGTAAISSLTTRGTNMSATSPGSAVAALSAGLHNVTLADRNGLGTVVVSAELTAGIRLGGSTAPGVALAEIPFLSADRPAGELTLTGTGGLSRALLDVASAACLTIQDLVESILSLFGMCCTTPGLEDCLLADLIKDINAAHQLIYSKGHLLDYFNRDTITVTIGTGGSLALSNSIQNICDDVRYAGAGNRRLALCTTQLELDGFVDEVYGGVAPAGPRAYFVDSARQLGYDSVGLTLKVTPAPAGNTDFLVDVSYEPARYTQRDIAAGTLVQMPHAYAELILLPILRKWASRDRRFTRREQQPEIDQQFDKAMQALGEVEPATPAEQKSRPKQPAAA